MLVKRERFLLPSVLRKSLLLQDCNNLRQPILLSLVILDKCLTAVALFVDYKSGVAHVFRGFLTVFAVDFLLGLHHQVFVDPYGALAVASLKVAISLVRSVLEAGVPNTWKSIEALKAVMRLHEKSVGEAEDVKGVEKNQPEDQRDPRSF